MYSSLFFSFPVMHINLSVMHFAPSVLKMIANLLPEDGKHTVGGTVEVNGINSKDTDIIWSVSSQKMHGLPSIPRDFISFAHIC